MRNDLVKTAIQNLLDQFAKQEFPAEVDCQIEPSRPGRLAEAELIAEFGGSVLCALQGITGYEAGSYRYLQMYAEGKEPEAVLRSVMAIAARVEKLVGIVLDAANSLHAENKAALLENISA